MILDNKDYNFHIRELGNCYRITIHERCKVQLFYVGVERLEEVGGLDDDGYPNRGWRHIRDSARGNYGTYEEAEKAASSLYTETVQKYKRHTKD
jgi:hypothetical protein